MVGISIKNKTKNILEMERVFVSRSMTESIAFEIAFALPAPDIKQPCQIPPKPASSSFCNQPRMRRNGDGVAL
jgi:hypothetical protein